MKILHQCPIYIFISRKREFDFVLLGKRDRTSEILYILKGTGICRILIYFLYDFDTIFSLN